MSKTFKSYVYDLVSEALFSLKRDKSELENTLKEMFDGCYELYSREITESAEKEFDNILEQYEGMLKTIREGGVPTRWTDGEILKRAIYLAIYPGEEKLNEIASTVLVEEFVEKAFLMAEEDIKAMKRYL